MRLALVIPLIATNSAAAPVDEEKLPPLSFGTVYAEALCGGVGATVGGIAGYLAVGGEFGHPSSNSAARPDYPRLIGAGIGMSLGAALATNWVGDEEADTSLRAAVVGAGAGTLVGLSVRESVRPRSVVAWTALTLGGPMLGATLGSTLFRRPKQAVAPTLAFEDGGVLEGFAVTLATGSF